MDQKKSYKDIRKLTLIELCVGLPEYIIITFFSIISGSIIMWVDSLDAFGHTLRSALLVGISRKLSKNLKYSFNYGVGKLEAITVLICDALVFGGLMLIAGVCIYELICPSMPKESLFIGICAKVLSVIFDTFFLLGYRRIKKNNKGAIAKSGYTVVFGALLFDIIMLFSLLLVWILRDDIISSYFSSVLGLIIIVFLSIDCIKRLRNAINELTDKTLPEKYQIKILECIMKYYRDFSEFHFINSRKSGGIINIDFGLSFEDGTTVEQVCDLKSKLSSDLTNTIGDCKIEIIIK